MDQQQPTEIILTSQQRAKQRYYQKIKNNPKYMESRRICSTKYYNAHKDDVGFKEKLAYQRKCSSIENEPLLNIIV